jgi:cytochrome b6-f complex subunit 4
MFKIAKGCGHNCYGEPAWPNEIFYVFPVVIYGVLALSVALSAAEPCRGCLLCNSFTTPIEIVPEWYFLAAFNDLRIIDDKLVGLGTLVGFALCVALSPFVENSVVFQNPFRRFFAMSSFLYFFS